MDKAEKSFEWLDKNNAVYDVIYHDAVFTVEDIEKRIEPAKRELICKNLFLRDYKGVRRFIVTCLNEKAIDLKNLGAKLGVRLCFGLEQRLEKYLNLTKGSVTPLGVLFNTEAAVEVIFDASFSEEDKVGVHPCENNATVLWILRSWSV